MDKVYLKTKIKIITLRNKNTLRIANANTLKEFEKVMNDILDSEEDQVYALADECIKEKSKKTDKSQ